MYLGEIQYVALCITSVIASAFSFLWYSSYVFGKKETRLTLGVASLRFALIAFCTLAVSALLNSLLITSIPQLLFFILWISLGLCSGFVVPLVIRVERVGCVSGILIEVGHVVFVIFTISSLLFLLQ